MYTKELHMSNERKNMSNREILLLILNKLLNWNDYNN